jgi:hypothetical protein
MALDCYSKPGNDLLSCALDDFAGSLGGDIMFGLLVGGVALFVLWNSADYSIGLPAVFLVLAGGFILPTLPPQYVGMAQSIMLLGLAAGLFAVARRYVLDPGAR